MFQTLLSPLKARFDQLSPRSSAGTFLPASDAPSAEDVQSPEDFARDVLVQLMRNSVENLKMADTQVVQGEILSEILRIMQQDAFTKGVFREMDGFLVLMSVLSMIQVKPDTNTPTIEVTVAGADKSTSLDEPENEDFFRSRVGYESLSFALRSLLSDPLTVDETLGLLLALSMSNFLLEEYFVDLRRIEDLGDEADEVVTSAQSKLKTIVRPEPLGILWDAAIHLPLAHTSPSLRYGLYKLFEALFHVNHRNQGVLASLNLVRTLFPRFCEARNDANVSEREKHALQKLLRRLLEMGSTTEEARKILQHAAVKAEGGEERLDPDMLDLVRFGMKSRWSDHFSMESPAALIAHDESSKGLPLSGFTFMMWVYLSEYPAGPSCTLFSATLGTRRLLRLSIRHDGKLQLHSSSQAGKDPPFVSSGGVRKNRWVHLSLVHYPHRGTNPSLRLFIDGVLQDMLNWQYPKGESTAQRMQYSVGSVEQGEGRMSWSLASAYLFSVPVGEDVPRFIHHLGPRYSGNFQDPGLVRFLTYEASTSLNMFLTSVSSKQYANPLSPSAVSPTDTPDQPMSIAAALGAMASNPGSGASPQSVIVDKSQAYVPASKQTIIQSGMMKVVKFGVGVSEAHIVFSFSAADCQSGGVGVSIPIRGQIKVKAQASAQRLSKSPSVDNALRLEGAYVGDGVESQGDVFVVKAACLDSALWKIGGAAVALKLVQLAKTPHELSRSLGILVDGLRNSWQNSEDMERLRGYEILAEMLRSKASIINLTAFETVFEFLGVNFSSPEHSTVVNVVAYRVIALDFDLWSRSKKEIQQVYLEHFVTLLKTSRYKTFNAKQRLSKMNLVRKLLFALQADWYHGEMLHTFMEVLQVASEMIFSKEETIKPLVSYLAANLHEGSVSGAASPHSVMSRFEVRIPHEKAEGALAVLVSLLSHQQLYAKFITALPITRICLLLLGDHPSPTVAFHILRLVNICLLYTSSFSRKFELISGWSVMKTVLPTAWSLEVSGAAFDILLGRFNTETDIDSYTVVACQGIMPSILTALGHGLSVVSKRAHLSDSEADAAHITWDTENTLEAMLEAMMKLHTSSSTFREIFRSQQATQMFIDGYKQTVEKLKTSPSINQLTGRIIEKLSHLGLALALDNAVAGGQKREILDVLQNADSLLNPTSPTTVIDPNLVADTRSVRQRFASARFSMQVGERTVIKTMTRMAEWRKTIQVSERKRLRKTILDLREHRRQIARLSEWSNLLTSERGLWPDNIQRLWRLDETEGPHRIRMKLEPQDDKPAPSRVDTLGELVRDVHPPESDTLSVHQAEVPPWAESYEISSTDMEDKQLVEDIVDDKLRRIRHELEPGDFIEAVATVARIAGVDSSPGLLIIGRTHIYMLDGVVENDDGEVIDAHDAPKRLLFIPGSIVELDGPQRAQRWSHAQIATCSDKRFLFRDVALEVYFKDSRSLLVVFLDKKKRSDIEHRLTAIITKNNTDPSLSTAPLRTPLFGRMGSRVLSNFRADELSTATRRWQAREISNFTYLSILNQISGRTPSDATQYPIFPWVLADYSSETLDLSAPEVFRDLTKPMGALTAIRREAAETRYANLKSVDEEPFHYGTHFSSSMIVCHFLIRLAPFTHMFKTLQGGDWDLPDRLFSNMARAYASAAEDPRGDVRELIPEFFTCPEFLENYQHLDFGVLQQTGERIDDVKLPVWARDDPLLFIVMNRRALESPYVSEHLPQWIDLIWGSKQKDVPSLNVFHPLSYEGLIDLDKIKDDLEREATVGIIHNFGQTPRKLFNNPHPERLNHGLSTLPIGTLHGIEEDPHLLTQNERCFKDLGPDLPIREFVPDSYGDKLIPCQENVLTIPLHPYEQIAWGGSNSELRVLADHKVVQVIESTSTTCAAFADAHNLVTGASDYTVRLWKVLRTQNASELRLALSHIMRVHTNEVVCVTASRTWSLVVSGSKDGSAALWDLNRGTYVRSIWHGKQEGPEDENMAVTHVAINESTGYIATCSRLKLCLHTVNARLIATLDLTTTPSFSPLVPSITSIAFHERDYSNLGVLATGGPDGTITLRTWTADGTPVGEKAQWEFLVIRTMKAKPARNGRPVGVTALKFSGETLYHGEESGKSFIWTLPD
ncbi:hypothetical protein D9611_009101 [Ephemerocybe angulata]|uniref:Beach-domain-containing protein n=1 Tax=Ephemerocybe angulata TaxID=980116 RepID=A0A8H5FJW3_9AGAR|nr:hypothetical protein D9611_009101 [Tulosesus angulatus]